MYKLFNLIKYSNIQSLTKYNNKKNIYTKKCITKYENNEVRNIFNDDINNIYNNDIYNNIIIRCKYKNICPFPNPYPNENCNYCYILNKLINNTKE
jgi:hypothetical protein